MSEINLTFNVLTFKHPEEQYTFYFTNEENEDLIRVHQNLVPKEVITHFGEQEHYYMSFTSIESQPSIGAPGKILAGKKKLHQHNSVLVKTLSDKTKFRFGFLKACHSWNG